MLSANQAFSIAFSALCAMSWYAFAFGDNTPGYTLAWWIPLFSLALSTAVEAPKRYAKPLPSALSICSAAALLGVLVLPVINARWLWSEEAQVIAHAKILDSTASPFGPMEDFPSYLHIFMVTPLIWILGDTRLAARLAGCLCAMLTAAICARLASRIVPVRSGIPAVCVSFFTGSIAFHSISGWTQISMVPLLVAWQLQAARAALADDSPRDWTMLGMATGMGAWTLYMPAIAAGWTVALCAVFRRRSRAVFTGVTIFCLHLVPLLDFHAERIWTIDRHREVLSSMPSSWTAEIIFRQIWILLSSSLAGVGSWIGASRFFLEPTSFVCLLFGMLYMVVRGRSRWSVSLFFVLFGTSALVTIGTRSVWRTSMLLPFGLVFAGVGANVVTRELRRRGLVQVAPLLAVAHLALFGTSYYRLLGSSHPDNGPALFAMAIEKRIAGSGLESYPVVICEYGWSYFFLKCSRADDSLIFRPARPPPNGTRSMIVAVMEGGVCDATPERIRDLSRIAGLRYVEEEISFTSADGQRLKGALFFTEDAGETRERLESRS